MQRKVGFNLMLYYYHSDLIDTPFEMAGQLNKFVKPNIMMHKQIIILCIGSDRSTGDSLGPLIGYKLTKRNISNVIVYGTLDSPVHAANLSDTIDEIHTHHPNSYIIAIDASLGKKEHIGCITLGTGALKPGLGVKKKLPAIGDIHITGIVNFSGTMDTLLLQTTRLSTIMTLADTITESLIHVFGCTSISFRYKQLLPDRL